ncbi:hypothetical protein IJ596_02550 [bacterium]|nr:hypothetical protein [bacterium]
MDFIHDFNNVPQKHFDEQIKKANLYEEEGIEESKIKANFRKNEKRVNDYKKPYFIRDKKNRHILHRYKD